MRDRYHGDSLIDYKECCVCSAASLLRPWYRYNDTDSRNEAAQRAYQSVLTVTVRRPNSTRHTQFAKSVKQRATLLFGDSPYGPESNDHEVHLSGYTQIHSPDHITAGVNVH
jgi:hypothetical protein